MAVDRGHLAYRFVQNLLKNGREAVENSAEETSKHDAPKANVRGADYYVARANS
jgi:hypothetical protein